MNGMTEVYIFYSFNAIFGDICFCFMPSCICTLYFILSSATEALINSSFPHLFPLLCGVEALINNNNNTWYVIK